MKFAPSIGSLFITGFLIFILFFIFITNIKSIMRFDLYKKITIILLFMIAIGIHGTQHLGVESIYNFNPYDLLVQQILNLFVF